MVVDMRGMSLENVVSEAAGGSGADLPLQGTAAAKTKVVIDTDPGIDDALAIFMIFQSPQFDLIGLTTTFGNVATPVATKNALYLCEIAGRPEIPVVEGSLLPLQGVLPPVADFIHGSDGFGNLFLANPKLRKAEKQASDFLVEYVTAHPGELTVVALGPLTNIAHAIKKDKSFVKKLKELVILGGAFFSIGNINPAAEANIYADPEAADLVLTSGANTVVIGINLTTQVTFSPEDLIDIRDSKSRYAKLIFDMCSFYKDWHYKSEHFDGIFLHDPTCIAALINPSLFTYKTGAVRVETQGICTGHTLLDQGLKKWSSTNPWTNIPHVRVGWTVDVMGVKALVKDLLMRP